MNTMSSYNLNAIGHTRQMYVDSNRIYLTSKDCILIFAYLTNVLLPRTSDNGSFVLQNAWWLRELLYMHNLQFHGTILSQV